MSKKMSSDDKMREILLNAAHAIRPPPDRTPDQWADQCRILPPGTAEPGPWRSSRTPYMIDIMRACANPKYKFIILVCGAQMGKTEGLFNVMGARLDDDPIPMIYVGPTQKQVESISADRVTKMLKSVPSLWRKLAKGQKNKISEKFVGGVRLGFGWAGSATELSSHPAGLMLIDERDRMDNDVEGEGDPVGLAEARVSTYPDGTIIITSTPTIEGSSPIWALYEDGSQHQWSWPCPDCGEYFVPKMELLKWPEGCTGQRALKESRLACPHCGSLIDTKHKHNMNKAGRFVAPGQTILPNGEVEGDEIDTDTISFWVSGLCSPWRSFGQRAKAFIDATKSGVPGRVQAAVNTGFGELYHLSGEAPPWESVANLRQGYDSGDLPEGVQLITCGVDVQKDRLFYSIRGWGFNFESWLIRHGEVWGETEYHAVWTELGRLLDQNIGGSDKIAITLIDSGFKPGAGRISTNMVYDFCRLRRMNVFPTKGHDKQDRPLKSSQIDVTQKGKTIKKGLRLWHIDTDYMKSWVHARITWPTGEPGGWHLPHDATDDYCRQIVAEQRLKRVTGIKWIQTHKDNHYLDCEVLNIAAAHILQVQNLQKEQQKLTAADYRI